jgi:hypothetical protein
MGPTVESDELYKHLEKQTVQIQSVIDPTAADIQDVLDYQKQQIKAKGISSAPRTLVIFDDTQVHSGKNSVMTSQPFLECFLANRHNNLSVWLAGQSYTATPRRCRLQCRGRFYFAG